MSTDLTFITNEPLACRRGRETNLLERFRVLIKDARFFDSLVGYFYTSEFFKETLAETGAQADGPREVILSEYFITK